MSIRRRTWLVTGASSGLGLAIARHAIERGHNLVATARKPEALEPLMALAPDRVLACRLDVCATEEIRAAVTAGLERFGAIDVLFNNAGQGLVGALEETSADDYRAVMETNFFGLVEMTRAMLPHFRARGEGAVVNISSIAALRPNAGFTAYAASKFAVEGLSEALARELSAFGIKVLIVEPGALLTEFTSHSLRHADMSEDYAPLLGEARRRLREGIFPHAGDAAICAAVIEKALMDDNTPLRLQLGADAISALQASCRLRLEELQRWEADGRSIRRDETSR